MRLFLVETAFFMKPEEYHIQTEHTWESVRRGAGMDWSRQPEVFKLYPQRFKRVALSDNPKLSELLRLGAGVTATKIYPGGRYSLRAQPSAGALYPCELYLQAREVAGLDDGLYHYQPDTHELCFLSGLEQGGLEAVLRDRRKVRGVMLLVTALYYRSSWKYRNRALRYCLLDSGHAAGALEAAALCMNMPFSVYLDIERSLIENCLDLRARELPVAVMVSGKRMDEQVGRCDIEVAYTEGTGFFTSNSFIISGFNTAVKGLVPAGGGKAMDYGYSQQELSEAIQRRRSIRRFRGVPLEKEQYESLQQVVEASQPVDCGAGLNVYTVVNRVNGVKPGVYYKNSCVRAGDYSGRVGYLCLEQSLCAASGVTLFITADDSRYLQNMFGAGFLGQRIYLHATLKGYGCSGIGAFYDREVSEFLNTGNNVLYALTMGN